MTNEKLRQLIAEQNDESERHTASRAKEIIREIAACQQAKVDADKEIAGLREELKQLTAPSMDETSILGG
jgi:hypothetical protein